MYLNKGSRGTTWQRAGKNKLFISTTVGSFHRTISWDNNCKSTMSAPFTSSQRLGAPQSVPALLVPSADDPVGLSAAEERPALSQSCATKLMSHSWSFISVVCGSTELANLLSASWFVVTNYFRLTLHAVIITSQYLFITANALCPINVCSYRAFSNGSWF